MKKNSVSNCLLLISVIVALNSCIAGELLTVSEPEVAGLSINAAEVRSLGLISRGGSLAIANESAFYSNLRFIRMMEGEAGANPRLLFIKEGVHSEFAEVLSQNAIRRLGSSQIIYLEGKIFSVSDDFIEIMSGKLKTSKIIDKAYKGDAIYVLKEENGWYKIKRGAKSDEIGYVKKGIIPISVGNNTNNNVRVDNNLNSISPCEAKNTGDFSFTNKLDNEVGVIACEVNTGGCGPSDFAAPILILKPHETKKYYDEKAGTIYEFQVYQIIQGDENPSYRNDYNYLIDGGEIITEKCQANEYIINPSSNNAPFKNSYKGFMISNSSSQELYYIICDAENGPCGLGNYGALLMFLHPGESKFVYSLQFGKVYNLIAYLNYENSSWRNKRNYGKIYDQAQIRFDQSSDKYLIR